MNHIILRLPLAATVLTLAACASTPTQFYTLMPPAVANAAVHTGAPLRIAVMPVTIPAQVDRPQLVVREADGAIVPVETRQWIAPLASEIRGALSADLTAALGAEDVYGVAGATPAWRVNLVVRRFDSALGAYARIDAVWSLRSSDSDRGLTCTSSVTENISAGYAQLAQGHQHVIAQIAAQIATSLRAALADGTPPACPASSG